MAWDPTSHHGFESSSTYQGGILDGNFAQENQYGYGERYQSWDMEYDQGETNSSQISYEEENLNLAKLILEQQKKFNENILMLDITFGIPTPCSRVVATSHVESINTNITQWNEEQEDEAHINGELQQEAEGSIEELEALLGCMVDENLVISYEDPCEGDLVVDCIGNASESSIVEKELLTKKDTHVQLISKMEKKDSHIEEASKEGEEEESPMAQPFAKYLGLISTNEESIDDPWKLPFEEVRMQEFRGWFYDEYDPGDPSFNMSS